MSAKLVIVSLGEMYMDRCAICGAEAYDGVASKKGPEGCQEAVEAGRVFCDAHILEQFLALSKVADFTKDDK